MCLLKSVVPSRMYKIVDLSLKTLLPPCSIYSLLLTYSYLEQTGADFEFGCPVKHPRSS